LTRFAALGAGIIHVYAVRGKQTNSRLLVGKGRQFIMKRKFKTMDTNEAVAYVAYRVNEVHRHPTHPPMFEKG
jgi:hypothetical protein